MSIEMPWVYDDGGRAAAGYKGDVDDCAVRAVAIATGKPYQEVYDALFEQQRKNRRIKRRHSPRRGVTKPAFRRYMASLKREGWHWLPTMEIGSGCILHLHAGELPKGKLIAQLSGHVCAVIDGVVHDTFDPSRDGSRCVYGYWYYAPPARDYTDVSRVKHRRFNSERGVYERVD